MALLGLAIQVIARPIDFGWGSAPDPAREAYIPEAP